MLPVVLALLGGGAALSMFALLIARMCGVNDRKFKHVQR